MPATPEREGKLCRQGRRPPAGWPNPLTLRALFERAVLPDLVEGGRAPQTIAAYRTALNHWERRAESASLYHAASFDSVGRFPAVDRWKAAMEADDYSAGSIKKYWRSLKAILRRAAAPGDRNPRGLSLIERLPYMRPPKGPRRTVRRFVGDDEVTALYEACERSRPGRKDDIDRPALLRLAVVYARTYGPRTRDLFRLHGGVISTDPNRPSDGISFDPLHPDPSSSIESPLGWFSFTTRKTRVQLVLPISPAFRSHLETLGVRGDGTDGPVFPPSFVNSNNVLYRAWDRVATTARERLVRKDPTRRLPSEPACFQDLRKTANTLWKSLHPQLNLGGFVLGHRVPGVENASMVNEEYYTERAHEVVKRLFVPPDATDLDRHFAWKELPAFQAPVPTEPRAALVERRAMASGAVAGTTKGPKKMPETRNDIDAFDYETIEARHRATTREDAKAIRGLLQRTGADVIDIGKRLCAAHKRIGSAHFQLWLKAEFRWTQPVASNYMQAARAFGQVACVKQFQPSALFELSRGQVPKAAFAQSVNEAQRGDTITRRRAQEIIAAATPAGALTPLSRDAVRRVRASLNLMAEQIDTLVAALEPDDLNGLVEQLFDMAARLKAHSPKVERTPIKPLPRREPAVAV